LSIWDYAATILLTALFLLPLLAFCKKGRRKYIAFGLGHAFQCCFGTGFSFDLFSFVITGSIGLCLGIMAESTGSLVLPFVSHNLYNAIVNQAGMLK